MRCNVSNNPHRRRATRAANRAAHTLRAVMGVRMPGGCGSCDAYQKVTEDELGFRLTVHHDDWCPIWVLIREQRSGR